MSWPAAAFAWSDWLPLQGSWLGDTLPSEGGLYRLRVQGSRKLAYIGQTGTGTMTLKKRMGMLRGVYKPEMPYRAPHTAGPALWALRHRDHCEFEVAVIVCGETTRHRKALEATAQALYRQNHGRSPLLNFGRMPLGYEMSSANNAGLKARGQVHRGGPTRKQDASHAPSIAPTGPLESETTSAAWCGHRWSAWCSFDAFDSVVDAESKGLYRVRRMSSTTLIYVGEGKIRERLRTHRTKGQSPGHPQEPYFCDSSGLEVSWRANPHWLPHQRQELETDLIGSHMVMHREPPHAQFLG